MADYNSSLPIRTENNGDVVAKIADATIPSQQLAIDSSGRVTAKFNDGTGNALTSQASGSQRALDVGIDVAGVQIDPRQIRSLAASGDSVKSWIQDSTGNAINNANPLPVTISSATSGVAKVDYNTASAIAANATSNHDYAITSTKTLYLYKVFGSASGKLKIEVQTSPDGTTFTTRFVGFNSTANPVISMDLSIEGFPVTGAGSKVRVIRTNLDKQSEDVYSSIVGIEQ